jgi:ABC-type molybdate transport system substrate-binding protein
MHNIQTVSYKLTRRLALASVGLFLCVAHTAQAAEIRVITSGAFTEAYKQLAPMYEQATSVPTALQLVMHLTPFLAVLPVAKSLT